MFRANGQKTGRLAKRRKNPQTDEERVWGVPASQREASQAKSDITSFTAGRYSAADTAKAAAAHLVLAGRIEVLNLASCTVVMISRVSLTHERAGDRHFCVGR